MLHSQITEIIINVKLKKKKNLLLHIIFFKILHENIFKNEQKLQKHQKMTKAKIKM